MRAANVTWGFYNYGATVHGFTVLENPVWTGNKNVVRPYIQIASLYKPCGLTILSGILCSGGCGLVMLQ